MIENPLPQLIACLKRYLILPKENDYYIVSWWILHTYFLDLSPSTPRLAFISPEYGCGKSRALKLVSDLSFEGLMCNSATRSALMRYVERIREESGKPPTLAIDEMDNIFKEKSEHGDALRVFLNGGYTDDAHWLITEGEGKNMKEKKFRTFAPIVIAGKGERSLPESVATRSITFRLQRALPHQKVERYGVQKSKAEIEELREGLLAWSESRRDDYDLENLQIPATNRDDEVWLPLYGIALLTDSQEKCLEVITSYIKARASDDPSYGVELLRDCLEVIGERDHAMTTELLAGLKALSGRGYADLNYGKGISDKWLAKTLKPYGIAPTLMRFEEEVKRGYSRFPFLEALERYSPDDPAPAPVGSVTPVTSITSPDSLHAITF